MNDATSTYTMTVFDSDPACSGPCSWDGPWKDREVRGRGPDSIMRRLWPKIRAQARRCGEYERGTTLWAIVWGDGQAHQYSTTI